jgi:hypothetical protein
MLCQSDAEHTVFGLPAIPLQQKAAPTKRLRVSGPKEMDGKEQCLPVTPLP